MEDGGEPGGLQKMAQHTLQGGLGHMGDQSHPKQGLGHLEKNDGDHRYHGEHQKWEANPHMGR